jgi:uncharacterized alkaline shock family protein YloU
MYKYRVGLRSFLHHVALYFKGVKVYALVGKAGTGKSFRAQLVAQRLGIDMILDDGLLIKDQRILAGQSAKKDKHSFSAVKTALLAKPGQARKIRKALQRQNLQKILILGTSVGMVERITERLDLPHPKRVITIGDIATKVEIDAATRSRKKSGKHIIPVPAVEVKKDYGNIFLNSVRVFIKRRFPFRRKVNNAFEKTVVRPEYSGKGKVSISRAALTQMVMHCAHEYNPAIRVSKLVVSEEKAGYKLEVVIEIPLELKIAGRIHGFQRYVLENIEQFTGIDLQEVNITVGKIRKTKKVEDPPPEQKSIPFPEEEDGGK